MTNASFSVRQRHGMILFILVSLLWLNFLSAIVVVNPDFHQRSQHWLTGEKVLICTVHGLQWVSVSDFKTQESSHSTTQWQTHCPLLSPLQPVQFDHDLFSRLFFAFQMIIRGVPVSEWLPANNKLYELYGPKQSPPVSLPSYFNPSPNNKMNVHGDL
ncbi:hypothetical protein KDD30_22545 (plasmid) [Photobacterium sp. GJ3]|uniref:hypothetical protein n=1 Tax=Photobacterium sp. GJ3 TaxID=2829502 RepID=UPI001B8BE6B2|nr:hypothetical protein [Photobacterium sp. GJ3]QUJ69529.1 hypothetical protein KDD30_22545 [Photobacterium sp. GJ3]